MIKSKILFVLCLLFGLMMINSGLNKFFNYMPMPKDMPEDMLKVMGAFMTITWLMPLVGAIEVIAGVLIIIPKYRALGAIMILPVMVGILLTTVVSAPASLAFTLILLAINVWAIIDNREKYMPMVS